MELRTLRYFVAVANLGSVTAAAASVPMTQPSMSRQIRDLERELQLELFDRREGRLRLTAAGLQYLPVAQRLLAHADEAVEAAQTIAAGRLQHLTIAAPGTTLTDVIAPFLATLSHDDPMPAVWEEVPTTVYATLARGADLAIGTAPPQPPLVGRALADLPVWAYVPRTHPWADREAVELSDLLGETLLLQTRDFHPRRALDQAVSAVGLGWRDIHEFATAEVAQAVAASGRGIAVVSDDPRFGLRPLAIVGPHGRIRIHLYAAWERHHHGAAAIGGIARRLAEFCVQRYGEQVAPGGAHRQQT